MSTGELAHALVSDLVAFEDLVDEAWGRWSVQTIAAAAHIDIRLTREAWHDALDEIERAIGQVIPQLPPFMTNALRRSR